MEQQAKGNNLSKENGMKASFCTNAFGNTQQAIEQAIPKLAQMGYDGLEFWEPVPP